jgi:dynein heavy chain
MTARLYEWQGCMQLLVTLCCCALVQAELTKKRLERAGKLTSGLSEEGVRWRATGEQLQKQIELLVGDVFISAACIAYYGAFTGSFR